MRILKPCTVQQVLAGTAGSNYIVLCLGCADLPIELFEQIDSVVVIVVTNNTGLRDPESKLRSKGARGEVLCGALQMQGGPSAPV